MFEGFDMLNALQAIDRNKQDIKELKQGLLTVNDFGIHVIDILESAESLPESAENYGDAYLVGTAVPYNLYVWTQKGESASWVDIGKFPALGIDTMSDINLTNSEVNTAIEDEGLKVASKARFTYNEGTTHDVDNLVTLPIVAGDNIVFEKDGQKVVIKCSEAVLTKLGGLISGSIVVQGDIACENGWTSGELLQCTDNKIKTSGIKSDDVLKKVPLGNDWKLYARGYSPYGGELTYLVCTNTPAEYTVVQYGQGGKFKIKDATDSQEPISYGQTLNLLTKKQPKLYCHTIELQSEENGAIWFNLFLTSTAKQSLSTDLLKRISSGIIASGVWNNGTQTGQVIKVESNYNSTGETNFIVSYIVNNAIYQEEYTYSTLLTWDYTDTPNGNTL